MEERDFADLTKRVKVHEGYRSRYYLDSQGVPTIGYGHNLHIDIPEDVAFALLQSDLKRAVGGAHRLCQEYWEKMGAARQGVVAEMVYQIGIGGVRGFRDMLRALAAGDYQAAADAMLDSLWEAQTPDRAKVLAQIMRTGVTEGKETT